MTTSCIFSISDCHHILIFSSTWVDISKTALNLRSSAQKTQCFRAEKPCLRLNQSWSASSYSPYQRWITTNLWNSAFNPGSIIEITQIKVKWTMMWQRSVRDYIWSGLRWAWYYNYDQAVAKRKLSSFLSPIILESQKNWTAHNFYKSLWPNKWSIITEPLTAV